MTTKTKWIIGLGVLVTLAIVVGVVWMIDSEPNDNAANREAEAQASVIELSEPDTQGSMSLEQTLAQRRSVREYKEEALLEKHVSMLLWAAQGVTDERRGFRTAPSAGATYPLNLYIAIRNVEGFSPGLYQYDPKEHTLIPRLESDLHSQLYDAALSQIWVKDSAAVLIYTAVFERTTRSYGTRGEQYVYIEVGHSAQNVYLQAHAMGLGTVAIGAFNENDIKSVLQLSDEEHPVYIMPVGLLP